MIGGLPEGTPWVAPDILFWRNLVVDEDHKKMARQGECYNRRPFTDEELRYVASNYSFDTSKFQGIA